jgi:tetratricopeptide (TPR) repeat protein
MKPTILAGVLLLTSGLTGMLAQTPAKGPTPKSKAESDAVMAVQSATDPDVAIKAAEDLLTKFADTDFKEFAFTFEARAYHQKRDEVNAQVFGERVLQLNPKSYMMEQMVAEIITQGIKDHDLDRADKLAKATKLFNDSIEHVQTATKPNPQIPDADWTSGQKFVIAESHNGLGMLATAQKHYPDAIKEYQLALDGDPEQDAYATRLAASYLSADKPTESIAICDKLLAKPTLHPQIKAAVESIKKQAEASKK